MALCCVAKSWRLPAVRRHSFASRGGGQLLAELHADDYRRRLSTSHPPGLFSTPSRSSAANADHAAYAAGRMRRESLLSGGKRASLAAVGSHRSAQHARLAELAAQLDFTDIRMLHRRAKRNSAATSAVAATPPASHGVDGERRASATPPTGDASASADAPAAAVPTRLSRAISGSELLELRQRLNLPSEPVAAAGADSSTSRAPAAAEAEAGAPSAAGEAEQFPHAYVMLRGTFRIAAINLTLCGAGVHVPFGAPSEARSAAAAAKGGALASEMGARRAGAQPLVRLRLVGIGGSFRFRPRSGGLGLQTSVHDLVLENLGTAHPEMRLCTHKGAPEGSAARAGDLISIAIDTAPLGSNAAAMLNFEVRRNREAPTNDRKPRRAASVATAFPPWPDHRHRLRPPRFLTAARVPSCADMAAQVALLLAAPWCASSGVQPHRPSRGGRILTW